MYKNKEMLKNILKMIKIKTTYLYKWSQLFLKEGFYKNKYKQINPYIVRENMVLQEKNLEKIYEYFSRYPDKMITKGENNSSVDGSGVLSSVDENVGRNLSQYIYKKFDVANYNFKITILDIGSGQGWLTKSVNKLGMVGYGFEGSEDLLPHFVSDKVYIYDMTEEIKEKELNKAFNITTSMEVVEHVPPEMQVIFWKNMSYLSDYHVCSIHCCPPVSSQHVTIWNNEEWLRFFKKNNIEVVEVISQEIWNKECAGYPKEKRYIPIKNIRGNWPCSLFYILKF